jgi:hypothetical protein
MEKEKAIQILNELIDEINQNAFDLFRWKTLTSNYMERLFVDSFIKKQNDIKSIVQIGTMSRYPPKNDKEKLELENKKQKSINDVKEKAKNFILDCVKEIDSFDLEEHSINKKLTEQLEIATKQIGVLSQDIQTQKEVFELEISRINKTYKNQLDEANQKIAKLTDEKADLERQISKTFWQKYKHDWGWWAFLAVIGGGLYFLGEKKFEKSKFDLEVKVDSLTKQSKKILMENKQGQKSLDSLQKLYIQSKQK